MPNLLFDLPQELVKKIYEYDPTYRSRYDNVLKCLPLFTRQTVSKDSKFTFFYTLNGRKYISQQETFIDVIFWVLKVLLPYLESEDPFF